MGKTRPGRPSMVTRKRAPVGAPPGTLVPDPQAARPRLHLIEYDAETIAETADATLDDVKAARDRKSRVWIDVEGLGDANFVAEVGTLFGLHPLALEDVLNHHQRPKAEDFEDTVFIVMHMIDGLSAASREQYSLFLGRDFVLTFQEKPGDCLESVRERLRKGKLRIRAAGSDYLAYAILDAIIDAYFPLAEKLGDRLEELEAEITVRPSASQVTRLHDIKRELLAVKRSLWPARELLAGLRSDDTEQFSRETKHFLRDTQDHVLQLIDIVETYRELASGLLDLYLSSMSNRLNEVMKVLTIIATIFIPLSFLAGVWGMNFEYMPELHWRGGYFLALGLMAAVAFGLLGWFRRKKWL